LRRFRNRTGAHAHWTRCILGDAVFAVLPLWTPTLKFAAIAIGIVGGFMNLAIRRPAAQPA